MNQPSSSPPRLLDAGDGGLVVEFGSDVDEAVNRRVVALDRALAAHPVAGLTETVPTYRSLLVLFDPLVVDRDTLARHILALDHGEDDVAGGTHWRVPVRYGGEHGVDLEAVAKLHGLSTDELIAVHSGALYRVYMIGFAPGFAYLGGLPEAIHTSRRTDPRPKTPPRSVSIGGRQAAVSPPLEVPSGWHLLGQTPVRSYDPARDAPFLFAPGDTLHFYPVSLSDYDEMVEAALRGEIVAEKLAAEERAPQTEPRS